MDMPSSDQWTFQLFSAKAARDGGIVRRKISDVDQIVGRHRYHAEMQRRGFSVVENAGQYVIFCNREPLRLVSRQIP